MQEAAEAFEQEQRDEELRAQSEAGPSEPHNPSEPGEALLLVQYDIDSDGHFIPRSPRSPA
eukprot:3681676-Alexandrium_andersonii.AAC.1